MAEYLHILLGTSACLQWLCHSGERAVARGPLVLFNRRYPDTLASSSEVNRKKYKNAYQVKLFSSSFTVNIIVTTESDNNLIIFAFFRDKA